MKYDFKKGDIVEIIDNSQRFAPKGTKAVVKDYDHHSWLYVEWINATQMDGGYYPSHFKLVSRNKEIKMENIEL